MGLDQPIILELIFFFILITYLVDIVLMSWGEILFWSLMGVKGLINMTSSLRIFLFFKTAQCSIREHCLHYVLQNLSGTYWFPWNITCISSRITFETFVKGYGQSHMQPAPCFFIQAKFDTSSGSWKGENNWWYEVTHHC